MARERKFSTAELFRETERLLLSIGYEGFTVSLLADSLKISRAAIYKYYTNKDEVIFDFMIDKMTKLTNELQRLKEFHTFMEQLTTLLEIIFNSKDIHQVLGMAQMIEANGNEKIIQSKKVLEEQHYLMYAPLQTMIQLGKDEGLLNETIPNELLLSFIFGSIAIPNMNEMSKDQFLDAILQLVCHGIFKN